MNREKESSRWFPLQPGSIGMWAFIFQRLSGIGLVVYLYLHLTVLNRLRGGPSEWDSFLELMRSPIFIFLDVVLLFGFLIHALNGLRLTLLGFGRLMSRQAGLFWAALALALLGSAAGALMILVK